MLTAMARLLDALAFGPRQPNPGLPHPAAQRLPRHPQIMAFGQLLGRQRRTKICVVLSNQRNRMITHNVGQAVVRRPATPPVGNRRCTAIPVAL